MKYPLALFTAILIAVMSAGCAVGRAPVSIAETGAVGDDATLNTAAIQSAIDRVAREGGGTVLIPGGVFVSGALHMKPGVNLYLEESATLKCATGMEHFPKGPMRMGGRTHPDFEPALINAEGCDGLRIEGAGVLDGAGRPLWDEFWRLRKTARDYKNFNGDVVPRARMVFIGNSRDVTVRGLTFKDSQLWNCHLYNCRGALVEDVRFIVPDDYRQAPSTDGVDLDSCQDVTIRNCFFSVTDDCIALKGTRGPFALEDKISLPVERIRVEGCTFKRGHGAITCGSEATFVRDVTVEGCRVLGRMPVVRLKLRPDTPQLYENLTFRDLEIERGGTKGANLFEVKSWTQHFDLQGQPQPYSIVRNVTVDGVRGALHSLGQIVGLDTTEFGPIALKNVDVTARSSKFKIDGRVKNMTFENVTVNGEPMTRD